jgi:hypothetical protein
MTMRTLLIILCLMGCSREDSALKIAQAKRLETQLVLAGQKSYIVVPSSSGVGYSAFRITCTNGERLQQLREDMGWGKRDPVNLSPNDPKLKSAANNPALACSELDSEASMLFVHSGSGSDPLRKGYYLNLFERPDQMYMVGCRAIIDFMGLSRSSAVLADRFVDSYYESGAVQDLDCLDGERNDEASWTYDANKLNQTLELSKPEIAPISLKLNGISSSDAIIDFRVSYACNWLKLRDNKSGDFEIYGKLSGTSRPYCPFQITGKSRWGSELPSVFGFVVIKSTLGTTLPLAFPSLRIEAGGSVSAFELGIPKEVANELSTVDLEPQGLLCEGVTVSRDEGDWSIKANIRDDQVEQSCRFRVFAETRLGDRVELGLFSVFVTRENPSKSMGLRERLRRDHSLCAEGSGPCYEDVASFGAAFQSSVAPRQDAGPLQAIDGSMDLSSLAMTQAENDPSWTLNLVRVEAIEALSVWAPAQELKGAVVDIYGSDKVILSSRILRGSEDLEVLTFDHELPVASVKITKPGSGQVLRLAEMQLWKASYPLEWSQQTQSSFRSLTLLALPNFSYENTELALDPLSLNPDYDDPKGLSLSYNLKTSSDPLCKELEVFRDSFGRVTLRTKKPLEAGACSIAITARDKGLRESVRLGASLRVLKVAVLSTGPGGEPSDPPEVICYSTSGFVNANLRSIGIFDLVGNAVSMTCNPGNQYEWRDLVVEPGDPGPEDVVGWFPRNPLSQRREPVPMSLDNCASRVIGVYVDSDIPIQHSRDPAILRVLPICETPGHPVRGFTSPWSSDFFIPTAAWKGARKRTRLMCPDGMAVVSIKSHKGEDILTNLDIYCAEKELF